MIKIANKLVGNDQPCFIIAEAGVNHNGDIEIAKKLIDAAADAAADAVKFQTWITDEIVTKSAEKAGYQKTNWGADSFYDNLKNLELSYEAFKELFNYAKSRDIICLSTPDDITSLDYLVDVCDMPAIKIGSGAITDIRLIKKITKKSIEKNIPVILSTGMSALDEITFAVNIIKNIGNDKLILLHCTSTYPTNIEDVNLRAMKMLETTFNTYVGYSDHTLDKATPIVAVALGAVVIEKHFTLDRNLPGPDHQASLEPEELTRMVDDIRRSEIILGSDKKEVAKGEEETRRLIRRSIVAKEEIFAGTKIEEDLLTFKIPGTGLSPKQMDKLIGLKAKRNIKKDELIKIEDFE
ncbi:N-acetylneuraminate synthase [Candidatus Pacearchaeota archaeon]|nr:N-acetylneuraminate synthase [Candidatus Pacearchaeota archaeon]